MCLDYFLDYSSLSVQDGLRSRAGKAEGGQQFEPMVRVAWGEKPYLMFFIHQRQRDYAFFQFIVASWITNNQLNYCIVYINSLSCNTQEDGGAPCIKEGFQISCVTCLVWDNREHPGGSFSSADAW